MVSLTDPVHALIDKVTITHLNITTIDNLAPLIKSGELMINHGAARYIYLSDGKKFSSIYIKKTSVFDCFKAFIMPNGGVHVSIELSVRETDTTDKNDLDFHNLNCWTVSGLQQQLWMATVFLKDHFGMHVDTSDAQIRCIEINQTFPINDPFECYRRPLIYILSLPSAIHRFYEASYYRRDKECRRPEMRNRTIQTYLKNSGSRGMEFKIYDKTAQLLNDGFVVDRQYMRVELVLKSPQRIRASLGFTSLKGLTDDKINCFFHSFIKTELILQSKKKSTHVCPYLRQVLLTHYGNDKNGWADAVMNDIHALEDKNNIPIILSVEELTALVNVGQERYLRQLIHARESIDGRRPDSHKRSKQQEQFFLRQRRSRIKKNLKEACIDHQIYIQGDQLRVEEIFNNLLPDWKALMVSDQSSDIT